MAGIIFARLRPPGLARLTLCTALHWEAPYEVCVGEWPNAVPVISLCDVLGAHRHGLSERDWNPTLLLRPRLLFGSLPKRCPAARKPRKGIVKAHATELATVIQHT